MTSGMFRGPEIIAQWFVAISICSSELNLTLASINAAARIHKTLLSNIMRQPNHFFDYVPIGRILSRFSIDISTVDQEVNFNLYETIESGCVVRTYVRSRTRLIRDWETQLYLKLSHRVRFLCDPQTFLVAVNIFFVYFLLSLVWRTIFFRDLFG